MAEQRLSPEQVHVLRSSIPPLDYDIDSSSKPVETVEGIKTTADLVRLGENNPSVKIDALVMGVNKEKQFTFKRMDKKAFCEAYRRGSKISRLREAIDNFGTDQGIYGGVGNDFLPLLGGPFNKQLYYYDYLKMHQTAFHAFHHDPIGKAIIHITRDFTLGRGFRVDCDSKPHLAIWRAFEDANNLQSLMDYLAIELAVYGEIMLWKLPQNDTKIGYQLRPGQEVPKGIIPRVRLVDPSSIPEVVTYPEDITRVLYYQFLAPMQYQMYTGVDGGESVPATKFVIQQIPANEMIHYKINCVSGEKRGRSDLYPVLGYMKRLRDSVNYAIILAQKNAAWAIDTTVEGSPADVAAYVASQQELGSIAPAGSEFVHTKKVSRNYLGNSGGGSPHNGESFNWCLSMICAGVQIPTSYIGTHLSGGQTKASALVSTEPVAKKFEMRQLCYENILKQLAKYVFKCFDLPDMDIEVTFPEIIAQDATAKLKNLALAETQGWITKQRAATIAAKELSITEFEFEEEVQDVDAVPASDNPLTTPGIVQDSSPSNSSAVTKDQKRSYAMNN